MAYTLNSQWSPLQQTLNYEYYDAWLDSRLDTQTRLDDHAPACLPSPVPSASSESGSSSSSLSPPPTVKEEPEDVRFIMELSSEQTHTTLRSQAQAPPTEVPLRATQATPDMRRMMKTFRLNPFAIHTGEGRGTVPAPEQEARPLDAEPITFEFQLDIGQCNIDLASLDLAETPDTTALRSFSPSFELHQESPSPPWPSISPDSARRKSTPTPRSRQRSVSSRRSGASWPRLHQCKSPQFYLSYTRSFYLFKFIHRSQPLLRLLVGF
ncbi:hypothetical protein H0H81_002618 [Sphagnurus paluster]|uniref:Uncharacterized protein n=1 Tax=Sphagnurus paluster TaxID=117069 RepID=A0A9P7GPI4_9AGAR|nr:hypothetical protein H0H81_002618 [Sphagnurus paluster]